jgi:hypothetical protein
MWKTGEGTTFFRQLEQNKRIGQNREQDSESEASDDESDAEDLF